MTNKLIPPNSDFSVKLILLGDSLVGKTSLMTAFTDTYINAPKPTIGFDLRVKYFPLDRYIIKINVLDSSGQEQFSSLIYPYYRGAHGALLVYDITNRSSFNRIEDWNKQWQQTHEDQSDVIPYPTILVGTKADQKENREVPFSEGNELANRLGIPFYETSSLTKQNIDILFRESAQQVLLYRNLVDNLKIPNNKKYCTMM